MINLDRRKVNMQFSFLGEKTVVSYILLLPYKGEHFNILYLPNREENLKATMMILLIKRRKVNQVISEKAS